MSRRLWGTRDPGFAGDLRAWLDRTVLLFSDRLLAFEAEDARIWGRLSAEIGHHGVDLMIAASALRHGAVVVTGNPSDFAPTGAAVENPFQSRWPGSASRFATTSGDRPATNGHVRQAGVISRLA